MKTLIVLEFDAPTPEDVAEILNSIDPPHLPYFQGRASIVVPPHTEELQAWLDEPKEE